jgi:CheY-like chemotaxis protein
MRCLLVDDEPGIRDGLAMLLRRKGHEVHTAGDCAQAATQLAERDFDCVITDWRLPDGTAAGFVAACGCPVIAISGHPEEVLAHAAIRHVLQKPVAPKHLIELLAAATARPAVDAPPSLPRDVQQVVDRALACLPTAAAAELVDDGAFVVLRAPLPDDSVLDELADLGGDLRVLAPGGRALLELRLCRDGRPDAGMAVVAPEAPWPAHGEFAVDFHGVDAAALDFGRCLDRAADCRARGVLVHFLNVPDALLSWASCQGRAHDMPMREKVGPRLPAVLQDLWSAS